MAETMAELNRVIDKYDIQMGTVSYTDSPNALKTQTVNFPRTFNNTPKVFITYTALSSGSMLGWGVSNVTKSKFDVGSWSSWSSAINRSFYWIAIAEK